MAEHRIRPPKDKEALISHLIGGEGTGTPGIFASKAHLLAFAAVLGYRRQTRRKLGSTDEGIRQEIFERNGFSDLLYLLPFCETNDPSVLAPTDEADQQRGTIFEEYANGGLEILRSELKGVNDPLHHILILIQDEKSGESGNVFDVSNLA